MFQKIVDGFVMILIIYALIGDDLRLATTDHTADYYFDFLTGTFFYKLKIRLNKFDIKIENSIELFMNVF